MALYAVSGLLPDPTFGNYQNIAVSDNVLVIYKMLDPATLLKLCIVQTLKSKSELTQKDFLDLDLASI